MEWVVAVWVAMTYMPVGTLSANTVTKHVKD